MSFRGGRDWDNQDRRYGNSGNTRGQVRRREDDELGWDLANKRRRYDVQIFLGPHACYAYSISQDDEPHDEHSHGFNAHREESGRGQRGADRDDWREGRNVDQDDWKTRHDPMEEDTNYDQRQHWNKSKRIVASEPSEHVIFLGLDLDFMESDVCSDPTSSNTSFDVPSRLAPAFCAVLRHYSRYGYHNPRAHIRHFHVLFSIDACRLTHLVHKALRKDSVLLSSQASATLSSSSILISRS